MNVASPISPIHRVALGVALLLAAGASTNGCDSFKRLRNLFHPEGSTTPTKSVKKGPGLRVDVTPPKGITILLDGRRVAQKSPYIGKHLTPGGHLLQVRAMGYLPFNLPVTLQEDKTLRFAVALRPRRTPPTPSPTPMAPRAPTLPPPEPPAAPLPAGVKPIVLRLAPSPDAPIQLDGVAEPHRDKELVIARVTGRLRVGDMLLQYRVGGAGTFELTLPRDGATWHRDGAPLRQGDSLRLHRGTTRLERTAATDVGQALLIRRL